LLLAFTLVYLSWGTTFLAIKMGVQTLPPALFGGSRVGLAGLILLAYLAARGQSLRLSRRDFFWTALVGLLLFVGGNGLLTWAEREESMASGVASILTATTPLWMAFLEMLRPRGERLTLRGWSGLLAGLVGVAVLLAPQLQSPWAFVQDAGPLLVLGSTLCWTLGSFLVRVQRLEVAHLPAAAYQMALGGGSLFVVGLLVGETRQLNAECFTPQAVYAFFHLLVLGSLVGFVAYNWLLGNASAAMVGTYAYVNPVIAILVGRLFNNEGITPQILGSMAVILAGVALVRSGGVHVQRPPKKESATGKQEPAEVVSRRSEPRSH
jgi:drug/metabolite transporter (DMT)-like permease